MSFIATSAVRCSTSWKNPKNLNPKRNGGWVFTREARLRNELKMHSMLTTGLENGHDCIILSAFGCGAYRNPSDQVVKLFKNVIKSGNYLYHYKLIVFAVIDDSNSYYHSNEGNYKHFTRLNDVDFSDKDKK